MADPRAPRLPGGVATAHRDTFARDSLPPRDTWPEMDYGGIPELDYPDRLNCAVELLDGAVAKGWGERTVFRAPGVTWTYSDLLRRANQIAHVLVEDMGLVPGNRVLLRAPNSPMLAATWFAVLKAGGVVVCTIPLSRARELVFIADKAEITLALTDTRLAADCAQAMAQRGDGSVARRRARPGVPCPNWREQRTVARAADGGEACHVRERRDSRRRRRTHRLYLGDDR